MALFIFTLFCLVIFGQRYTSPMVTVVCPVTNLHHMACFEALDMWKMSITGHFDQHDYMVFLRELNFTKLAGAFTR